MKDQTFSPEVVTAIALRAALRAQPAFRLHAALFSSTSLEDQRQILTALFMGAWSGFCVFSTSYAPNQVLSMVRNTQAMAAKWGLRNRPEFVVANATEAYLSPSPRFEGLIDELIQSSGMLEPHDFAASAVRAIEADVGFLSEDSDPAVLARQPLWQEPPPVWPRLLEEYVEHLREHGLSDYASGYLPLIRQVSEGTYIWDTPDAVFRRWPDTPSQHAETQRQTSEERPRSIDLTAYSFSLGARHILANATAHLASRDRDALSSRAVVFEMAEQGRTTNDPQWIADFVRQALSPYPEQYAKALEGAGFRPNRRRTEANDRAINERMMDLPIRPGLAWSLNRARAMARETTGSDTIAGRHLFAALIVEPEISLSLSSIRTLSNIGLSVPLLRQRLYEWVRGYSDDDAAWRRVLMGSAVIPRRRAGFDADRTSGVDLLNIDQDVLALATLIAARESSPPLSIGLFGDWGSGKTFFMNKLRRAVADLSAEARASNVMQRDHWFYKRIVQIEFNAWHYVEGNLWASLVEHILSNLRLSDDQESTITEKLQDNLIKKLGFAKQSVAETEKRRQDALAKVRAAESAVRDAKQKHERKQKELQQLSADSIKRDFDLGGVPEAVIEALKPLGIIPAGRAVIQLEESLRLARSVTSRGAAGLTALVRAPDRTDRWRSLLIILIGAPTIGGLLTLLVGSTTDAEIGRISGMVTGAAGLLTSLAHWIRKQAEWLSSQQDKVEEAQRKYDEALKAKLAEHLAKISAKEQELALASQDYLVARQRAEQARVEREEASAELAAATTPRLLGRFIQDRAASADYRKHLGVLAVVRQDFQSLSKLIEEDNWRLAPPDPVADQRYEGRLKKVETLQQEADEDEDRINRIVLYIDDLDRCPPAKVVEVLQAVHLLLAFPLFVVVVGVDARWISRSLESRYRELLRVGDNDTAGDIAEMFGVARSEDYLEKIFQIPLWLRRMDANDARRMVQGMLRASMPLTKKDDVKSDSPAPKSADTPPPPAGVAPSAPAPGSPSSQQAGRTSPKQTQLPVAGADNDRVDDHLEPPPTGATVNPESLTVRDFEIAVIDSLSPLLGRSPRALKRFVNLYRLIKAGLTPAEHDVFVSMSKEGLDDYAAVLFLLAMDTGVPHASLTMFEVLLSLKDEIDPMQLLKQFEEKADTTHPDVATLKRWIEGHLASRWFHGDAVRRLSNWAPKVMRHSFNAARIDGSPPPTSNRRGADKTPPRLARGTKSRTIREQERPNTTQNLVRPTTRKQDQP